MTSSNVKWGLVTRSSIPPTPGALLCIIRSDGLNQHTRWTIPGSALPVERLCPFEERCDLRPSLPINWTLTQLIGGSSASDRSFFVAVLPLFINMFYSQLLCLLMIECMTLASDCVAVIVDHGCRNNVIVVIINAVGHCQCQTVYSG